MKNEAVVFNREIYILFLSLYFSVFFYVEDFWEEEGNKEVHKFHQKYLYRQPHFYHFFALPLQHFKFMNLRFVLQFLGVFSVDLM